VGSAAAEEQKIFKSYQRILDFYYLYLVQKSILILLFFIVSFLGFSQNYPVQTTIQLTAPYTSYLPDYTDGINSKLQVALNITDVNEPILQVKLKFTLEGTGGKIVTNPNFIQSPIALNFGEVLILSGDELSPYLAFENLVFPSQTFEQNYRQTKVLPEGLWKLCVDVIDATNPSSELLSMNNCALIFVARLQPPMLNLPICETTLPRAQNIFFSWTDMALGSQAIGQEPLYDFSLYSVPLSAYNNPTQVLNTNPIFSTTTTVASFSLDTNEVFLPAGQKYLWQVRAKLPDGSGAYLNNGYSAPCTFVFGDLAQEIIDDLSINLTAQGKGPTYGTASWTLTSASGSSVTFESYVISYRKAGNPYFAWYEDAVEGNQFDIKQLEDSTLYEVKIKGIIGENETEFTDIVTFRTLPYPSYACGDGNIRPLSPTYTPLANENAYEGIKVEQGQFFMDVTSIKPNGMGAGRFKGTGKIKVDFLFVSVRVSFDNLLIDSDYTARAGVVNVITQGLDEWLHDQYAQFVEPIYVDGVISSATVTDSIGFVVIDGVTHTYNFDPIDYPIILNDEDGNQVTMFADGTVTIGTYLDVEDEYLGVNKDKVVFFAQNEQEVFGFDAKEHIQWHKNYEIIHCKDTSNYFVANKSIGVGITDLVDVIFDPSKTSFVTLRQGLTGTPIAATSSAGTKATFTLPAQSQGGKVEFYAFDDEDSLVGKLNVEVYNILRNKVVVVPLVRNPLDTNALSLYAKKIFKEANIDLSIQYDTVFYTDEINEYSIFDVQEDGGAYTNTMKNLRNAYLEAHPMIAADDYLIFVVKDFSNSEIAGYFPKTKKVGFVEFISDIAAFKRTFTHEIAHGIGGLSHTWENNGPSKSSSLNLMDYASGSNLIKLQWESLRNPSRASIWDENSESQSGTNNLVYYFKVKVNNEGKVLSREFHRTLDKIYIYAQDGTKWKVINTKEVTIKKVVNIIMDENGIITDCYERENVVYYDYNYINSSGKWERTYAKTSREIQVEGYDGFPVNDVYTIKRYYKEGNLIDEEIVGVDGKIKDPNKLASGVDAQLSIHYKAAKFLSNYYEISTISLITSLLTDHLTHSFMTKVNDGYDVTIKFFNRATNAIEAEQVVHLSNTLNRAQLCEILQDWGLNTKDSYQFYLFKLDAPDTWERWAIHKDYQYTEPPFAALLIADFLMAVPGAVYGFATGENWRTGEALTGWDYVFNTLELIPVAGVALKFGKSGLKAFKVYNKLDNTKVFEVFTSINNIPVKVSKKFGELKYVGLRIAAESTDALKMVYKNSTQAITTFVAQGLKVEKYFDFTASNLDQVQVVYDFGKIPVKVGNLFQDAVPIVYKNGDNVGVKLFTEKHYHVLNKVKKRPEGLGNLTNSMRLLDYSTDQKLFQYLDELDVNKLSDLNNDFTPEAFVAMFKNNPERLKAWEALSPFENLRTNLTWLQKTSGWIDDGLRFVDDGIKVSIRKNGIEVAEISNDLLKVKYPHYGGDVLCHQSKTTTVVGKYELPGGEGTKKLIDSKLTKSGENSGGINVLNDTRDMSSWSDQQIWDIVNKPWLDAAASRGDVIRAVSDPTDFANIYKNGNPADGLSFFGREVERLNQLGYTWNSSLFLFIK
jgi:hypothetical protein